MDVDEFEIVPAEQGMTLCVGRFPDVRAYGQMGRTAFTVKRMRKVPHRTCQGEVCFLFLHAHVPFWFAEAARADLDHEGDVDMMENPPTHVPEEGQSMCEWVTVFESIPQLRCVLCRSK